MKKRTLAELDNELSRRLPWLEKTIADRKLRVKPGVSREIDRLLERERKKPRKDRRKKS